MNQTNPHFTQWKNLTPEQQADHDFKNYAYEYQNAVKGWSAKDETRPENAHIVYRLKIEPEKFYYVEESEDEVWKILKGSEISPINTWPVLRPAKPSEIPELIPTGEDLVGLLCGVSNQGLDTAKSHSIDFTRVKVIESFDDGAYETYDAGWLHAYPVRLKDIESKLWSPE